MPPARPRSRAGYSGASEQPPPPPPGGGGGGFPGSTRFFPQRNGGSNPMGGGGGGGGGGGSAYNHASGQYGRRHSTGDVPSHPSVEENHYRVLGVDKSADVTAIKKAYHAMARMYHPDKNPGDKKDEAAEKFRRVQTAWETVGDKESRDRYDSELRYKVHRGGSSW